MSFDKKNPKFLIDLITMIFAIVVIVLAMAAIMGGFMNLLTLVFYFGAAMFAANIIRGFVSRRYWTSILIMPLIACIFAGLATQGVIKPWIF